MTESHYAEMVALHRKYSAQGLSIVAFPSNQFGYQEPGSDADIKAFAASRGASFNLMSKIDVNGPRASPVYKYLKSVTRSPPHPSLILKMYTLPCPTLLLFTPFSLSCLYSQLWRHSLELRDVLPCLPER